MPETPDPKPALRKTAYAARKRAFADPTAGAAATEALLAEIGPARAQVIAGYMPIRTEIDPRPAMVRLAASNRICVPVIDAPGRPLWFREWTPDSALVEGPFGALIPAEGAWLTPGILVVPLVGFDAGCNRLGYGGGYYDRTLEKLRATGPVRALGFAFAAQHLPALPLAPTDQRLDAVVTETGTIRP